VIVSEHSRPEPLDRPPFPAIFRDGTGSDAVAQAETARFGLVDHSLTRTAPKLLRESERQEAERPAVLAGRCRPAGRAEGRNRFDQREGRQTYRRLLLQA